VLAQRLDTTETGEAKALSITELSPAPDANLAEHPDQLPSQLGLDRHAQGLTDHDLFTSITNPGKLLLLASWNTADNAAHWTPTNVSGVAALRHRRMRNVRDYGMFERREAPQYYPDAQRP
jgi:hypothetical protein